VAFDTILFFILAGRYCVTFGLWHEPPVRRPSVVCND